MTLLIRSLIAALAAILMFSFAIKFTNTLPADQSAKELDAHIKTSQGLFILVSIISMALIYWALSAALQL